MTKKNALLFTANDPQVAQGHLLFTSLRDRDRGNFDGDIWVISTHLDERTRQFLDQNNMRYFVDPLDDLWEWPGWKDAARANIATSLNKYSGLSARETLKKILRHPFTAAVDQVTAQLYRTPAKKAFHTENRLRKSFENFRDKRQSKFIVAEFVEAHGDKYENLIVCDNDIFIQSPVDAAFEQVEDGKIFYRHEEFEILPGTPLWTKNAAYKRLWPEIGSGLDAHRHEINIGFIAARSADMGWLFASDRDLFLEERNRPLLADNWHDQDYVRVLRAKHPDRFKLFTEDTVVHLCNGGENLVEEGPAMTFTAKMTGLRPMAIHFAGGRWRDYASIQGVFDVDPNAYYEYYMS